MAQPILTGPVLAIARDDKFFHVEPAQNLVDHRVWDSSFAFYDGKGQVLRITRKSGGGKIFRPSRIACDPMIPFQRLNSAVANLAFQLYCHDDISNGKEIAARLCEITGDLPTKLELVQNFKPNPNLGPGHTSNRLHNLLHRLFR